ncbi:hypothetical protein [Streptomyces sp. NPDC060035]|uniref:effector-associated constant component EACC1 n=1 Tax=Streptomyces sp. NPDC060035 TaxID=3347044 RepID=UPI0036B3D81C
MRIRILGEGDDFAVADLHSWLRRDPGTTDLPTEPICHDARGSARAMGTLDALDIILGHGTDLASFAIAYATWRATRKATEPDRAVGGARLLTHGSTTVDIGNLSPAELSAVLRRLESDGPSDEEPGT